MSNTPVKNGAIIFLRDHGEYLRCDAYEMLISIPGFSELAETTAYYFRITEASATYVNATGTVDYIITDCHSWFDRVNPYSTMICTPDQVTKL